MAGTKPCHLVLFGIIPQVPKLVHIVSAILTALTGFPNLTGFLNEFDSLIVN